MSDTTLHKGSCHCGAVKYEVNLSLENVIYCNCSICSRSGTWLAFVPAEEFKLLCGEDHLSDYLFNTKTIHHLFCKNCGIRSFAKGKGPDGKETVAVNVRCLEGINLENIKPVLYDGKSM